MAGFFRFFFSLIIIIQAGCVFRPEIIPPCGISSLWYSRNSHLIPTLEEAEAVSLLDFDRDGLVNSIDDDSDGDGIENSSDKDRDGDGVMNRFDPSPGDPREQGYNPFGMLCFLTWDHDWNEHKYPGKKELKKALDLISQSGCNFVRIDFYWGDIEPEKGKFVFEKIDMLVDLIREYDLGILGILDYSAPWAAESWNAPPFDNKDYAGFCRKVVSRYKDRVKYWEIWNEPDSPFYWTPQDNMKKYTELLKAAYPAVKETDPSARVLLGGLTQSGYYALQDIYRQGGKAYFDIMNIHPFVDPLDKEGIKSIRCLYGNIRRLMAKYGDSDKKIWFTEIGCPGLNSDSEYAGWWMGQGPDEREQARFLADLYQEIVKLEGVEKIFWAFFRDNKKHFKSGVDYFGLVRWDFSPKPAFYAYKKAAGKWQKNYRKDLAE